MTLLKGTTTLTGSFVVLCLVAVSAAAGKGHPAAAEAGCVTRECHARLRDAGAGPPERSLHQPVSDGDCVSCHDLGLSAATRFVKGAPAGGGDGPDASRAWDQELCAECHADLLAAKGASGASTRFVAGGRNLHALHVQAGRGRRCLTCHDPHRSRQPRLLREQIPARGTTRIAQQFRSEPMGGWCKTGCHAPKGYRR